MQDSNLKPALPGALQGIGIDQKLDAQIPLNLMFRDETGQSVPLSSFFKTGKPVILAMVYYRCPNLCTLILNGLRCLKPVSFDPGKDFEVLSVNSDPEGYGRACGIQEENVHEAVLLAPTPPTAGIS